MITLPNHKTKLIVYSLLVFALTISVATGAVAAVDGERTIDQAGDQTIKNETGSALSATSGDSGDGLVSTFDSDTSYGSGTQVAVTTAPTGQSFSSSETMDIFVGAFNGTTPRTAVDGEPLNVTVERPNGTVETFEVTTGSNGRAQVDYDLSAAGRGNGTYSVTVEQTDGDASATIAPTVGPTVIPAQRDYETIPVGEETTFDFFVANGEFGQSDTAVNISVIDPTSTQISKTQVTTDEDGFANVSITPQQQGQYTIEAELANTQVRSTHKATARNIVFRTTGFGLETALDGEQSFYGGYLDSADGLVANTEVVVNITNAGSNEVVLNTTTTTDSGGFFIVAYSPETADDDLRADIRTVNGTLIRENDYIDVDDPYPGDTSGDDTESIGLDISPQNRTVEPGKNATFEIDAVRNGSAVSDQNVSVFARLDYTGVPLVSQTVTTDANGAATVSVRIPDGIGSANIEAEAVTSYNGTTISETAYANIRRYLIERDVGWGRDAGQEQVISFEVRNQSGSPVPDVPVQYNALYSGSDVDSYATGEITTNQTGIAAETIAVPRSVEPYNSFTFSRESSFTGYYVDVYDLPGSMEVTAPNETSDGRPLAQPGEELTINITTPNGTQASGLTFAEFEHNNTDDIEGSAVASVTTSANGALTVPAYAGNDSYVKVEMWAADSDGYFYTAEQSIEIDGASSSSSSDDDTDTGSETSGPVDLNASDLPGSGTVDDPYVITNASELQAMEDDLSANYTLDSDIDASGTAEWNNGSGFDPIGGTYDGLAGSFDGAGHTISGVTIDRPNMDGIGVFAGVDGSVTNLTLTNVSIKGSSEADVDGSLNVGGLAARNAGTIENVTISGTVIGGTRVGGLAGTNDGTIKTVQTGVDVSGHDEVGVLVGRNSGPVNYSVSTGSANGANGVGGLVGLHYDEITASYAVGSSVTGSDRVGGLVGASRSTSRSRRSMSTSFRDPVADSLVMLTSPGTQSPIPTGTREKQDSPVPHSGVRDSPPPR